MTPGSSYSCVEYKQDKPNGHIETDLNLKHMLELFHLR